MVKLTIKQFFEYTDDENDVVWLNSIETLTSSELERHRIGLSGNKSKKFIYYIFYRYLFYNLISIFSMYSHLHFYI